MGRCLRRGQRTCTELASMEDILQVEGKQNMMES